MQPDNLEFWIDINLPPALKDWIVYDFHTQAKTFLEMGFQLADDAFIFNEAAKNEHTIIITTKYTDYLYLSKDKGHPPKILHINTGNIAKSELKKLI
jgi:predicted nuclease of predicted toxin-antitoxin system